MKIVIAGAGDVGFHLAQLLSSENQDIVLIDTDQDTLEYAATHLDVMTIKGDSSYFETLETANMRKTNLLIAVTTSEKNNLITAILAKKMGAKQTIARVKNHEYLTKEQKQIFKELGIDSLISPRQLAAKEIQRLVKRCSLTDIFEFEEGKVVIIGITVDQSSPLLNRSVAHISQRSPHIALKPIAILRGHQTLIPTEEMRILRNDHIYFITKEKRIEEVEIAIGKKPFKVRDVMIVGGTGIAYETAKLLEKDYNVTLIEKSKATCKLLAEHLDNTLIIHGDPSNIDLLKEEGLSKKDVFIALTPNSESNIVTSLTAKNYGAFKTIALVENTDYTHISQDIGVDTLINKKLIAANNIFRFVRKGKVEAITSLHGVDAEIIEFSITKANRLTKKPLKDHRLPKTALIGGVIRGQESIIVPDGDFLFKVGDKVIVFALPEAIFQVEKIFH